MAGAFSVTQHPETASTRLKFAKPRKLLIPKWSEIVAVGGPTKQVCIHSLATGLLNGAIQHR
jgi:hypothetical protein